MAVYHLACRILADGKANPPARVAKYHSNCALPSCELPVKKGDMISCTRDNENGVRKVAGVKGAPDSRADVPDSVPFDLPFPEGPLTERAPPAEIVTLPEYEAMGDLAHEWEMKHRELSAEHAKALTDLAHALATVEDLRNVLQVVSKVVKGAL